MHSRKSFTCGKAVVSAALSFGLLFSQAPAAYAKASAASATSIEQITAQMNELYMEAEQTQYDLISANNHVEKIADLIASIDVQIEKCSAELEVAKKNLAKFVAEEYKQGGVSLLDIIFNSTSFEEFLSQVTYANKIAEHTQAAIKRVDDLYAQLTLKKSELEQALADQQRYITEQQESTVAAEVANEAAIAFIEQLPQDVVEQLASASAEQREEAMQATINILSNMDEEQLESIGLSSDIDFSSTESFTETVAATTGGDSSDMLSRVYSLLGSGYQYSGYNYTGDTSTSSFTCSGVVDYGLGRDSRSSSPETLYEEVGTNITTDVSSLQPGDLVFYSYGDREVGHVAVYIGDGQVIDSIPNGGVQVRDVDYMEVVGGGSLS